MTLTSDTKHDILHCLLRDGHLSAQELAVQLAISPQAVRRHLKEMEAAQLVTYDVLSGTVGRPQYRYTISEAGREELRQLQRRQHTSGSKGFALELLESVAATLGPDQVHDVLQVAWRRKAIDYRQQMGNGSLCERLARLVALRQQEGYMAEFYPVHEVGQPPAYLFTEYNCAISAVAQSFPAVCDHELQMFAIALEDCAVERTHWIVDGEHRCGYLIRPRS
ncbi:iron-sulfur cluster biosynthesis transcriptional regulator SufR [Parathermosynechococcus lividus PCC 6715]|uniref:Iron-sulfur cluster biosynthesis transcriptional regulator SufR n=1 Tax=Parathermosynechococcus lividus PCC 6715 TaxID=1917166 RepID=A0A2D2Q4V9_PARLV|nr:iron-sulfur cluster biosynthesis transcriptional regulator SufR [Thermostichus lividus]ATS19525.1 iron-sulfur cluster biosynthesis transcriptional regulator SufR [Thermostichus lividus PCC 6715]